MSHVISPVSGVRCQVSGVRCQVYFFNFFCMDKVVDLVGGGSVITGPTPSSLYENIVIFGVSEFCYNLR